jgi:hypothetical protein
MFGVVYSKGAGFQAKSWVNFGEESATKLVLSEVEGALRHKGRINGEWHGQFARERWDSTTNGHELQRREYGDGF